MATTSVTADIDRRIARLEAKIRREGSSEDVLNSVAWGEMEAEVRGFRIACLEELAKKGEKTPFEQGFIQGKVHLIDWVLSRSSGLASRVEKAQKELQGLREQRSRLQNGSSQSSGNMTDDIRQARRNMT